ncbi:arsenate reductase (glutaredoxin) [Hoyosella altamirensis]|uniref:arsenate reductase (glutathione/glutaredoxin) n=1 Tax=Hoyosella altamirensis TaxID=616997 RepID=A0A839RGT2_9ACTN|nr:arsenate reductase (glutaredoxin) [Hoyosella altamirensis]MBB3035932.1 arsenate reductase [Hoyosella altamirensis]
MSDVTIYHNPRCTTSRNVLAIIREAGIEPEIVKYLDTPPGRDALASMISAASLTPRQAIRKREKLYKELGLDNPDTSDDALLDAMAEHPILIERPIVVTPRGVRLARPPQTVEEIL